MLRREQLDPEWLKANFLWGLPLVDSQGNAVPDATFRYHIEQAVRRIEGHLDIHIVPRESWKERKDFFSDIWRSWSFFQLHRKPVRKIQTAKVMFGETKVFDIPAEWIRIEPPAATYGQVQLFPTLGTFGGVPALDQAYVLAPILLSTRYAPHVFEFVYDTGMDEVEEDLAHAIGLLTTIPLLVQLDAAQTPGVAALSISMDGLGHSLTTTRSAENTLYSARIKAHQNELWGWTDGQPGLMSALRKKWFVPAIYSMT